ncbi:transcriptional regulator [Paeniglutamicibacter gangotriensis]|uniref:Transcriptional regulator n=1 Tax=Paeniglutamicibacter gangotriensis TaxID=254787 RepID=A0A5B0EHK4_9MICC|nr:ATP-binding protein [Paeniglutamicibacter gangotriensis]KAA0977301.1 transcriptional regulator [Paeniglutamicibacter gangotriensis]
MIKLDTIRSQSGVSDWTSKIIADATLEHLDPKAVEIARTNFATKYANRVSAETVQNWSTAELLERVKLSRDGKLTRAALLLLGRAQSTHLLEPHPAQITWKLGGGDYAYEHFGPPFLLTTSEVFRRIGNTQLKIQPDDSLLPIEVSKYDRTVVLEALHNCVAHQDYARDARIIVTELEDRLVFENEGSFFEERPDVYVTDGGRTPRRYRNPYLTQAMAELNMIDTMGFGILRMFERQAKRSFPLPDYDLGDGMSVKLTVYGNLLDESYTKLLLKETDIPLSDVLALDRVQKARPIDDATTRRLRKNGLIEGRKPHLRVAAPGVRHAQDRATYILTKGQDDQFYEKLILDFISKWKSATRKNVDDLLISKLSDSLDDQQKANKVGNLLTSMRRRGLIENTGSRKSPKWQSSNRAG